MAYSSHLIGDYFLTHSPKPLTLMHLIKLTYIAHGFTLALTKKPLIYDRIEAWRYGPVIPTLYHAYKGSAGNEIPKLGYCGTKLADKDIEDRRKFFDDVIDPKTRDILDQVIECYGDISALQLSTLTHKPDTPWKKSYVKNELFTLIPNNVIQDFYEKKVGGDDNSGY